MLENQNLFSLSIDPVTKGYLTDIYKWTRFLAITGMVVLILGLIAVIMGASVSTDVLSMRSVVSGRENAEITSSMRIGMAIMSVIFIAIAFFPLYFLLQFSFKMKMALAANDQGALNTAFGKLKTYFKYLGILVIVCFVVYALVIFLAVMGTTATT